jgi:hypothetical protein
MKHGRGGSGGRPRVPLIKVKVASGQKKLSGVTARPVGLAAAAKIKMWPRTAYLFKFSQYPGMLQDGYMV